MVLVEAGEDDWVEWLGGGLGSGDWVGVCGEGAAWVGVSAGEAGDEMLGVAGEGAAGGVTGSEGGEGAAGGVAGALPSLDAGAPSAAETISSRDVFSVSQKSLVVALSMEVLDVFRTPASSPPARAEDAPIEFSALRVTLT